MIVINATKVETDLDLLDGISTVGDFQSTTVNSAYVFVDVEATDSAPAKRALYKRVGIAKNSTTTTAYYNLVLPSASTVVKCGNECYTYTIVTTGIWQ